MKVFYEDNHLIAVFKPAGLLVQGDSSKKECLMDQVKRYLKKKYNKKGNVFLGLLHRLDRQVSGIVLFAKTSKGAARLSEQFRNNEVRKIYRAKVLGEVKNKQGVLIDYISKDEKNRKAIIGRGKKAELSYKVISSNKKESVLEIELKTGRFHQIRAQLAHIGHPVFGDVKYGFPFKGQPLALSAKSLSFRTAVTKELVSVSIDSIAAKS